MKNWEMIKKKIAECENAEQLQESLDEVWGDFVFQTAVRTREQSREDAVRFYLNHEGYEKTYTRKQIEAVRKIITDAMLKEVGKT